MKLNRSVLRGIVTAAAFVLSANIPAPAADTHKPDAAQEQSLLETLRTGKPAQKAIACKQLAMHGSKAAVPELAKLLADEHLASWARIALEAIPAAEADDALRSQVGKLQGELLVGVINSIGVRRDAKAADPLAGLLTNDDGEVASAAAVALGHIGTAPAIKALRQSLASSPVAVRSAVAEGCILGAERLMNDGNAEEAAAIYDEVRGADVPKPRVLEATRGAILARKADGIPLLIEQLQSSDKGRFQLALTTARELQGSKITDALAAQLAKTKPDRAVLLLSVLADRNESTISPAVLASAKSGDKLVRMAAIGVIGRLGNEASLSTLLEIAAESDTELAQAAKSAIEGLPGEKIDQEIVAKLSSANAKLLPVLIELVGQRRIDARTELAKAVDSTDAAVRHAALHAMGATVKESGLATLLSRATDPKYSADAEVALKALKAACVRMPDREACAAELAAALAKSPPATQAKLIEILAAVGGEKSLKTIAAAAKSSEALLPDTATRVLGQWMSVDAGPVLLDLAKHEPSGKYRVRALRGYIRLARQFATSDAERAAMCQQALDVATRPDEQKLVFAILQNRANAESLQVAAKAMEVPALHDEAARVANIIAQKLGVKSEESPELIAKVMREPVELEIVKAEYGAGTTQKDVTETMRKHAGNLRWVALPAAKYNQCFGGDPAPNVVKQLKVSYRINGKPGDATFPENTLVVLPMPN